MALSMLLHAATGVQLSCQRILSVLFGWLAGCGGPWPKVSLAGWALGSQTNPKLDLWMVEAGSVWEGHQTPAGDNTCTIKQLFGLAGLAMA